MARVQLGELECLTRLGSEKDSNVILLHGFGADASDLFPLADVLDPDENWNFYFPEAPHEVPIGNMWTGRGWFPISVRDLESGVDFTKVRPPGMDESAQAVSDLIFHLNSKKLVLGGFSQGAMIAMEVAIEMCVNNPDELTGLVLWSGSMLDEAGWTKKSSALKGKPYVQSHGSSDSVLPFMAGQKLNQMLKTAGADGEFVQFPGAHEIPINVINKSRDLLARLS